MRTVLMLPFDEAADTTPPVDDAGQLAPLLPPAGAAMPAIADAWTGRGRDFDPGLTTGLEAVDATDGLTLCARDCSIEYLGTLRLSSARDYPRTIIQRGRGGSSAERINYRLRINQVGPSSPQHYEIALYWEDGAGAQASPTNGATILAPADEGDVVYLVATRRLERDKVVTRYYLNGAPIGESEAAVAGVGGGTTGHTLVGLGYDGGIGDFHDGVIDQLRVVDYELSPEEVLATWERLTLHQPNAVAATTASMPPGSGWGADPSTRWGRLVRTAGELVGQALARGEELRRNWLPDRAYLDWITRWERLVGAAVRRRDSLDVRRARVLDLLGRDNGFAVPQLKEAFADSMDLAASDVQILEYSNRIDETFDTLNTSRWFVDDPGGVWSVAGGKLVADLSAGGSAIYSTPTYEPVRVRTPLSSGRGRLAVQLELATYAGTGPADVLMGLALFNRRTRDAIFLGIRRHLGNDQVGYVKVTGGVAGAFVQLVAAVFSEPIWLRIIRDPTGRAREDSASTTFRLGWSVDDALTGFFDTDVEHALEPEWTGPAVYSTASWGAAGGLGFSCEGITVFTPRGTRPFHWYAYRDPGLPGAPNMARAHALAKRIRPAHTEAGAIRSLEVLAGEPETGLAGHGPCGGV
jgi:hypothetical protein